ncbi:LacI family DNA-binding transcriptional regulator, partial [Pantoea sp. SIMBA_133]
MPVRKASVSAKDVAARAGVSRAAVSRTFTPGASVSEETRSKVIAAAEALGYQVNHLARGLISQKTGIVAVVGADLATPYRSELLRALTERLQAVGRVAILINTDR